jgi:hypothetical protein
VVNRLGRTRDARYWYAQLVETYGEQVLPPVHLRAAIPEAAAQSLPIHGLGTRAGAAEAAAEFDALLASILGSEPGSDRPGADRPDDEPINVSPLNGVADAAVRPATVAQPSTEG